MIKSKTKRNRGAAVINRVTVEQFERQLDVNLNRLEKGLRDNTYKPQGIRRKQIRKPGSKEERPLGIPTIRDRIVQGAVKNVVEPIFEQGFSEHSYGFRPGRGCKDALRRVSHLLHAGYTWVVDADIRSYFDMIPHDRLMECLRDKIADGGVLALIESFLNQGILSDLTGWGPGQGTPQGAVISPLLANIYLNPLDHIMTRLGFEMIRYADDFVILCRSEEEARRALNQITAWVKEAGLKLHPEKTRIVDVEQRGGFDFLGYHFERGYRWPIKKSLKQFKTLESRMREIRTSGSEGGGTG
ncbi:MAG: group II intron reverse transcriptase/maturase [PVC group bacterium]